MKSLVIIISCLLGAYSVVACKCAPTTVANAVSRSTEVFYGTVTKTETNSLTTTVNFAVEKSFKGSIDGTKKILSTSSSSSVCGYPFVENEAYLVFVNNGRTSLCSGNVKGPLLPKKEEEVKQATKE